MGNRLYQDEEWFREQWYSSQSREEIAEKADCSVDTVTRYARIYGLPSLWEANPWQDEERLRKFYHDEGMSMSEIGEELGCSSSTVKKWMDRFGIESRSGDDAYFNRDPHPCFTHDAKGYEVVSSERRGEQESVRVHQLLAIADGEDPYEVFAGPGTHVHHTNGIKWDNRPNNIELLSASEHMRHHATENNPQH